MWLAIILFPEKAGVQKLKKDKDSGRCFIAVSKLSSWAFKYELYLDTFKLYENLFNTTFS